MNGKENYIYIYIHNQILLRHKKEWNFVICNNMVGVYYAQWSKSDRERQTLYVIAYMWILKNKKNSWISETRNRLMDTENKLVVTSGGKWCGKW